VEIRPGVIVYPDDDSLAGAAADRIVALASEFIPRRGVFSVALAGGGTPLPLYRRLASEACRDAIAWSAVQFFWGDERAVPPADPRSNFGTALREMTGRLPVPPANLHRMEAERPDLEHAARDYEEVLRRHLEIGPGGFPRLHLALLGMGSDGHTASLFPGDPALEEISRWVAVSKAPDRGRRMTLTLPVLNAAHNVFFLVTGAEKADTLRRVLDDPASPAVPAGRVVPASGARLFLVDRAAASALRVPR
jgi:6-phosphogluconolactonase